MSAVSNETSAAVRGIVCEYGNQILQYPKKLRAILADYLPAASQNDINEVFTKIERGDANEFLMTKTNPAQKNEGVLNAPQTRADGLAGKYRKYCFIAAVIIACAGIIGLLPALFFTMTP